MCTKKRYRIELTQFVCVKNPLFEDKVRDFRDRRYDLNRFVKVWGGKYKDTIKSGDPTETETCKNRFVLYDSLELAHKIILNSNKRLSHEEMNSVVQRGDGCYGKAHWW
jgi:hypothetical protein